MYIPAHFAETRPEELHRIIREHPLGVLVTQGSAGLDADHIPFEFDSGAGTHGVLWDARDRLGAAATLDSRGHHELAASMRRAG